MPYPPTISFSDSSPTERNSFLAICLALAFSQFAVAEQAIEFNRDVRPILSKHCFACHGFDDETREADLRLDTFAGATSNANESAPAIVPGKPDTSELWKRINAVDPDDVMPPSGDHEPLAKEEKETLRRWILEGAEYEQHWAFIAPVKPAIPHAESKGVQPSNPIDAFVQSRLIKEGLSLAVEADKATLLRRVTLDLTGLPPTLKELDAFLADDSRDAYERAVDDLQSRVTYGEHMGRSWLDLARYADTHGLHLDNERSMWPYRDWVVRAIHENVPFDDFTRWQLAGDLLPEPSRDQLVATGFNRCNVTTGEGGSIQKEWIFRYAVERTSATAEVWMGLTAGCAVCHDHKFDPLSTKEFYSLYAFFHSAADPAMDGNKIDTPPILKLTEPEHERQLAEFDEQIKSNADKLESIVNSYEYKEPTNEKQLNNLSRSFAKWLSLEEGERNKPLSSEVRKAVKGRPTEDWSEEERAKVQHAWLRHVASELRKQLEPIEKAKSEAEKKRKDLDNSIPLTFIMADLPEPRESFVMLRGEYDNPGEQVSRSVPAFLPKLTGKEEGDYNRLDLANWLLSREHPLTARVTVNRFWQQFFGRGLVETAEDFGTQGQLPSHPDLLDWLAVQFMDDGWDMKKLVRRIVTSHAYRQSSKVSTSLVSRDPDNRLYARGPRVRLDAEVLRDQALFVGGLLVSKIGGKGVNPYQPPNIWEPVAFGGSNTRHYKQGTGDDLYRRSLYTFLKRTAPPPFMSTFDAPNREQVCSRRGRSNTPMQALQLMNDVQHIEAARSLAERIITQGGTTKAERIRWAWRTVTARLPNDNELQQVKSALDALMARYRDDKDRAKELIDYGESEPNSELDASELAAYTIIGNLLLNLDETLSKN